MVSPSLLMSGRHQIVHSEVFHDLPIVIPRVREENRCCIESRGPEFLDVRISYLLQEVLIRQGADCSVCVRECIFQILNDIILTGQISGTLLIRRSDFIQTECDVSSLYAEGPHGCKSAFPGAVRIEPDVKSVRRDQHLSGNGSHLSGIRF